jgi:hypothetical protein
VPFFVVTLISLWGKNRLFIFFENTEEYDGLSIAITFTRIVCHGCLGRIGFDK